MTGQIAQKVRDIFASFKIDPKDIFLEEDVNLEIEAKLADGTSIFTSATEWAVGADVYTKDDTGTSVPLAEGDYTLEDGRTISVGADAKVAEISDGAMQADMSNDDLLSAIESLSARISALEGEKEELLSVIDTWKENAAKKDVELSAARQELSEIKKAPAASSVKTPRSNVALARDQKEVKQKSFAAMTVQERVNQYLANIK